MELLPTSMDDDQLTVTISDKVLGIAMEAPDGEHAVVGKLKEGSQAEGFGVPIGGRILSINGTLAKASRPDVTEQLKAAMRPTTLVISKGGWPEELDEEPEADAEIVSAPEPASREPRPLGKASASRGRGQGVVNTEPEAQEEEPAQAAQATGDTAASDAVDDKKKKKKKGKPSKVAYVEKERTAETREAEQAAVQRSKERAPPRKVVSMFVKERTRDENAIWAAAADGAAEGQSAEARAVALASLANIAIEYSMHRSPMWADAAVHAAAVDGAAAGQPMQVRVQAMRMLRNLADDETIAQEVWADPGVRAAVTDGAAAEQLEEFVAQPLADVRKLAIDSANRQQVRVQALALLANLAMDDVNREPYALPRTRTPFHDLP